MAIKKLVVKSGTEHFSGIQEEEIIWMFAGVGFCRTYEIVSTNGQKGPHWWEDGLKIGEMLLMEIRNERGILIADPTVGFPNHPNFMDFNERAGLVFRKEEITDVLAFCFDVLTE